MSCLHTQTLVYFYISHFLISFFLVEKYILNKMLFNSKGICYYLLVSLLSYLIPIYFLILL